MTKRYVESAAKRHFQHISFAQLSFECVMELGITASVFLPNHTDNIETLILL